MLDKFFEYSCIMGGGVLAFFLVSALSINFEKTLSVRIVDSLLPPTGPTGFWVAINLIVLVIEWAFLLFCAIAFGECVGIIVYKGAYK
jgi:hypothetical protein